MTSLDSYPDPRAGSWEQRTTVIFWVTLMIIMAFGVALRLWMLDSQLLVDDEWHGVNFVSGRSLAYVFTHHGQGANSIPMNVWRWVLLHSVGWSETWLRLPSIIAGIASMILFPLLVKTVFDRSQTLTFAFLLTLSPCLIFYSRMSRPYAMVAFLGFTSLVSFYVWIVGARRRGAVIYCVTGALAVWFHPYALIIVTVAPVAALGLKWLSERWGVGTEVDRWPRTVHIILVGAMAMLSAAALLLPAHLNRLWWMEVDAGEQLTWATITRYASLLSGTSNLPLILAFVFFVGTGMCFLSRRKPLLCVLSGASACVYALTLSLHGVQVGIQVARYTIVMVPLWIAIASYGIWEGMRAVVPRLKVPGFWTPVVIGCGLLLLVVNSPLFQIFRHPNNFTNHSAFQESYAPLTWEKSRERGAAPGFAIEKSQVSPFYLQLAGENEVDAIIEYPIQIGDHYNLHFYFQHFHQKRVVGGYITTAVLNREGDVQVNPGLVPVDLVFSRLSPGELKKIHFRNLVDVLDLATVRAGGATYIVFHRHILQELFPEMWGGQPDPFSPIVGQLVTWYETAAGPPVYEDEHIVVYETRMIRGNLMK
ncbi:MAG: hypothetical protein V3R94_06860 [Acidobacteriota bacterium]